MRCFAYYLYMKANLGLEFAYALLEGKLVWSLPMRCFKQT